MRSKFSARPFFLAFFFTLLFLLFVLAGFAVDAEGQRLSFNDASPAFEVLYHTDGTADLRINAFSLKRELNFTGPVRVWGYIAEFLCLPHHRFPRSVS